MAGLPGFERDREFQKLVARRKDVDVTLAALELARDAEPDLEFGPILEWFDARGRELAGPVARARTERDALAELARGIAEQHGILGTEDAYARPEGSFLHRVIETRQGIPISLSVLYMAVAQRVGIDLRGVSTPMHFLARCETVDGAVFLDAYSGGRLLDPPECLAWISRIAGVSKASVRATLKPASPRTIVIRMLHNLKAVYARQEDWSAAWTVQRRLTALEPASYQERRDLALISLHARRPG
ncbi:MAG TPA: transglutaminase family protein, partial [Planctomycetaceae bacterium]|nr:transglutaminase family protein [Planctomycetaceae bacterium]